MLERALGRTKWVVCAWEFTLVVSYLQISLLFSISLTPFYFCLEYSQGCDRVKEYELE